MVKMGESAEAVANGLVDMTLMGPCFYPGAMAMNNYGWGIPFGIADANVLCSVASELRDIYPQLDAELDQFNCKGLFYSAMDPYMFFTVEPLTTVADLEGKKIGAVGQFLPSFPEAAGAIGITAQAGGRYTDMSTGLMDGSMLHATMSDDYKFYEVAKYATFVGWGGHFNVVTAINKDVWNQIPFEDQMLFEALGKESERWQCQTMMELVDKMVANWETQHGVTVYEWPEEEIAKWAELCPFWGYAEFVHSEGKPGYDLVEDYFRLGKEHGIKFAFEVPPRPAGR